MSDLAGGDLQEDIDVAPEKKTKAERKRAGSAAVAKILDEARSSGAAPPTDGQCVALMREWENSERTIARARQMLKDAIQYRDQAARTIVRRMGPGPYRWKDKLYSVSANGETIYLRELVQRPK